MSRDTALTSHERLQAHWDVNLAVMFVQDPFLASRGTAAGEEAFWQCNMDPTACRTGEAAVESKIGNTKSKNRSSRSSYDNLSRAARFLRRC